MHSMRFHFHFEATHTETPVVCNTPDGVRAVVTVWAQGPVRLCRGTSSR
jgi:hypothetical protein